MNLIRPGNARCLLIAATFCASARRLLTENVPMHKNYPSFLSKFLFGVRTKGKPTQKNVSAC